MLNITWYTRTCRCQKVHCPPAELAASHHPGGDNNFLCPTAPEVGCYLRGADKKGESCVCRGVGGGGVGQGRQFPDVERNFWQLRITTAELGLETYCVPSIFIKGNYVFLLLLCLVKKFGCFYQAVAKIKTGLSIPAQTPLASPHWPCFLADFLGPPLSLGFLHLCPFSLGRLSSPCFNVSPEPSGPLNVSPWSPLTPREMWVGFDWGFLAWWFEFPFSTYHQTGSFFQDDGAIKIISQFNTRINLPPPPYPPPIHTHTHITHTHP